MRTTIDLPDGLADEAKRHAAAHGVTLREIMVEGLRLALARPHGPFRLRDAAFTGTPGFAPGVGAETVLADLRDDPAGRGPAAP